ncbi:MAG TPA: pyridoxal-phosphate dependent enzyme [Gemmatimonadales bacterium]|nr:pyridoxal-phosphate dependent enzyme [Gemmatimonadales bacterium]
MPHSITPLLDRFPALQQLPRAPLGRVAPPVLKTSISHAGELLVWRDDLNAPVAGGNKLRALEFLLGSVQAGDTVVAIGGRGSTHIYTTATHAARIGAGTVAVRWPHHTTALSEAVASLTATRCSRLYDLPLPLAIPAAGWLRLTTAMPPRRTTTAASRITTTTDSRQPANTQTARRHWMPFGGSSTLGILGQVNGALELVQRVRSGEFEQPASIVVPAGSCGTAAGLLLGLTIGGLDSTVVGARCGPQAGISHHRVISLARHTAALIRQISGQHVPEPSPAHFVLDHSAFGGAYGRPHPESATLAAELFEQTGVVADSTYAAKALLAASRKSTSRPAMLWSTFDAREFPEAAEWWKRPNGV